MPSNLVNQVLIEGGVSIRKISNLHEIRLYKRTKSGEYILMELSSALIAQNRNSARKEFV